MVISMLPLISMFLQSEGFYRQQHRIFSRSESCLCGKSHVNKVCNLLASLGLLMFLFSNISEEVSVSYCPQL